MRIAVIGAGPAGLAAARTLKDHAMDVTVFDKGRGPGGRTSTRFFDGGSVDHGAPFLTFSDERLKPWARAWARQGLIARTGLTARTGEDDAWLQDTWTAVPGMHALALHLAADLDVIQETRITSLDRIAQTWTVHAEDGREWDGFDAVVAAIPAPQASALLSGVSPTLVRDLSSVSMVPTWTAMFAFGQTLDASWTATRPGGILDRVIRSSALPGRSGLDAWVVHASEAWTREHLEADPTWVREELKAEFSRTLGHALPEPIWQRAHRWRFARPEHSLGVECLRDAEQQIVACGDWALNGTVEGALLSGMAAAGRLMGLADEGSSRPTAERQASLFEPEAVS